MAKLLGKTAAITGGAGGIGSTIAMLFAAEGARLAILDINDGVAEETAANLGAEHFSHALDVGDDASVNTAF